MGLDPEVFRSMTPQQIMTTLALESVIERQAHATSLGAKCVQCMDTGLREGGVFCGCSAGGKLGYQSSAR